MKIVIAPDSFKESLSALEVATAIEAGFRQVFPDAQIVKVPIADGGEGTVQALVDAVGGAIRCVEVIGPEGTPVQAAYGFSARLGLAVIEMAAASGLELVPMARRDPRTATSFGTGQLIRDALDAGARRFVIGLGGSATNDAGAGMLEALGARLLDASGQPLERGALALKQIAQIDTRGLDPRLAQCHLDVACDVTNPLLGPSGASAIFGPQKGATPAIVQELEACLHRFAEVLRRDLGTDIADVPGGGAAGGLGAALQGVLGAHLRPGFEVVMETIGLGTLLQGADLVITGEGRTDGQTAFGKAPLGVAQAAARCGVPVVLLSGALAPDLGAMHEHGVSAIFGAVRRPCTVEEALREAATNVRDAAYNLACALQLGMRLPAVHPSPRSAA